MLAQYTYSNGPIPESGKGPLSPLFAKINGVSLGRCWCLYLPGTVHVIGLVRIGPAMQCCLGQRFILEQAQSDLHIVNENKYALPTEQTRWPRQLYLIKLCLLLYILIFFTVHSRALAFGGGLRLYMIYSCLFILYLCIVQLKSKIN